MESKYSANHKLAERTVKNPVPEELMNKGKKLFKREMKRVKAKVNHIFICYHQPEDLTALLFCYKQLHVEKRKLLLCEDFVLLFY